MRPKYASRAGARSNRPPASRGGAHSARLSCVHLLLACFLSGLLTAASAGKERMVVLDEQESREEGAAARSGDDDEREQEGYSIHIGGRGDSLEISVGGDTTTTHSRRIGGSTGCSADDMVAFGQDIHVAAGQVVQGDVVSFMGSVTVDGMVQGSVVALGGEVHLGPHAMVQGDAVSIGGPGITVSDGSVIQGEAVALGGRIREAPQARIGERVQIKFIPAFDSRPPFFLRSGWVTLFSHLIFIGLVGWAVVKLFAGRWITSLSTLRARPWESMLAGFGAGILYGIVGVPLLVVIALILVALVVGIPLVPLVLLLLLVFPVPGYAVTAGLVGAAVRGHRASGENTGAAAEGITQKYLLGHLVLTIPWFLAVLMRVFFGAWFGLPGVFLLLGWGVLVLAIAFGWGALLLSRLGRRPPRTAPAMDQSPLSAPAS